MGGISWQGKEFGFHLRVINGKLKLRVGLEHQEYFTTKMRKLKLP